MASIAGSGISIGPHPHLCHQIKAVYGTSGHNSVSFFNQRKSFSSIRLQPTPRQFHVCCAAKPETVQKVCKIVRKHLALPEDSVTGESKFSSLGADSLDTVEIVVQLEEEFRITVDEESAHSIATVQDAADIIEDLVAKSA